MPLPAAAVDEIWDVLDQSYGAAPGVSFSSSFEYNWSPGVPTETLEADKARLAGNTALDACFYACKSSIRNFPKGDFTVEFKVAITSPGTFFNFYLSDTPDKTTATFNHILQLNRTYDKPVSVNSIADYNQRANARNVAPAGFNVAGPHVYRLVRKDGVTTVYLDGAPKPIIARLEDGAGASGDKQMLVFGFARPDQQELEVEFHYLKIGTGARVPGPLVVADAAAVKESTLQVKASTPQDGWKQALRDKIAKVGGENQLFIDDLFFDKSDGVSIRMHPARKTGEVILQADKPWESATLNWLNVIQESGKFRMWYECYDVDGWPTADDTSFCYAESTDGIRWTKPELGLYEYQGSKATNILFRLIGPPGAKSRVHGVGIFIDPKATPEARYKGVSQGIFEGVGTPPHRIAGMQSPDGINWTRLPQPVCPVFADSQYSGFWDSSNGKYVLFGRVSGRGRAIGRSESSDFAHFDPLSLVFETDDNDPPETDVYNPAATKYANAANVYLMFPSLFEHAPDTLSIHLAVSRDGIHWTRPEQRLPFVALGSKDEFDSGSLYMGQGIVRVGDELWQYYGGSRLKHKEGELENLKKPGNGRYFSRVVSRADGFVSADADAKTGSLTTIPLTYAGNLLKLNVAVREGGKVRVALLDESGKAIPGRSLDDCIPVTGDSVSVRVAWKTGADVMARAGKPTRLQLEITNASVYGFQFSVGDAGSGRDH
jgi:hypothetical protein